MPSQGSVARAFARASAPLRQLPDFLVIGGIRCGTTSMIEYLRGHPNVAAPTHEIHYFDWRFDRGPLWYRSWFPVNRRLRAGESSPNYLMTPEAPARAKEMLPRAQLIVLLRDPVQRAISHFSFRRSSGAERCPTLDLAIDQEEDRLQTISRHGRADGFLDAYLEQGSYIRGLRRWREHFDLDRMLILRSEDFFSDTPRTYARVLDFLELTPHQPEFVVYNSAPRTEVAPETIERLANHFEPLNHELHDETGIDLR